MISWDHCVTFKLLQSAEINPTSKKHRAFPRDFKSFQILSKQGGSHVRKVNKFS